MAEGLEPYHVPQQSRRDKLRVVGQSHPGCIENLQGCTNIVSFNDPSLLPSDLLTCASLQQQSNRFVEASKQSCSNPSTACEGVKVEGVNLIGYGGSGGMISSCSSSSATHHMYNMDPQTSIQLNPSSIQDVNINPYHYTPQGLRFLDHQQSFHGGEVVVYRPEPLSAAHAANNTTGQGLSLSLSSSHAHQSNLPLELNLPRYDSSLFSDKVTSDGFVVNAMSGGGGGDGSTSNDLSRNSVPLGPFTGYASILKGSRFLKPAQQLLEELCDVGKGIYAEKFAADHTALMDPPLESLGESGVLVDDPQSCSDGNDNTRKSRLISMLHEVYRRYKQYYQQMQAVVASFESVAGLSNAAPFANLAFKSMSKHFRSLKNALIDQLQFTTKSQSHIKYDKDDIPRFGNYSGRGHYGQRPVQAAGIVEHQPVWRPQRGLPERAVSVLRAWLFDHFLHPYPTDTDKLMLAKQTGLSRNQVSNWFINARVRLWKPMVEEIHMLETQEAQKGSQRKEHNANRLNDQLATSKALACDNPSTSTPKASDFPSKRTRNNVADNHGRVEQSINLSYDNFPRNPHLAIGANTAGGNNGVQLTLGLHQNNGIGLSEPFPINAAQRFGLDANSEGYVVGGFEAQNRQFGRNIVGGQLVRDFVG